MDEAGQRAKDEADGTAPVGDGHTHESVCLNCRTPLIGSHCHACGQKAHVHRTIGAFFHDLLHGVLHFEGKSWATLGMLAWRPGELTRRYIDGERARFVSPLALFLFTVFLMFAVFSSIGGPVTPGQAQVVQTGMATSARNAHARVTALEQQRDAARAAGHPTAGIEAELEEARATASLNDQVIREGLLAGLGHRVVDDLPEGFIKHAVEKYNKDPALTLYKLQSNAYKFSWLLIPIFVPMIWLLFAWRPRHWQLYDHTVFVTYSLSFQTLTIIVLTLLARAGLPMGVLSLTFGTILSVHVYRQLRGAYALRPFSAMWRMVAITVLTGPALLFFALAMIAIGAAG